MAEGLPLIGPVGVEFLTDALTTRNPKEAIDLMQQKGAMEHPGCGPVLQLLDQLGVSRLHAHQYVVQQATDLICKRVHALAKHSKTGQHDELIEQLLQVSFPYLGIPALRRVPIAAMEAMNEVPHQFLRQLGTDKEVFDQLPPQVKQQVWENDKKLLQKYAGEQIDAYKYETATIMRALAMDEPLPRPAAAKAPARPPPSRKMLRNASGALQQLRAIVGHSRKLYSQTTELIAAKLRDSESLYCGVKQDALCAVRSQLMMALHDHGVDMANRDPVHQLAWTLDACVGLRQVEGRHLEQLKKFFKPYETSSRGKSSGSGKKGSRGGRYAQEEDDEDASSAGGESVVVGQEPLKVLAEAGMVLRDPPVMHLMAHHVARRIQRCADKEMLPRDDPELVQVTRLLQLAAECRQMLRQQTYYYPEAPEDLLRSLFAELAGYCVDATMRREGGTPVETEDAPHPERVVDVLAYSEVGRKVTEALVLQRMVTEEDLGTTGLLLQALAEVLAKSSKAIQEMGPFAATLASRMGGLVSAGKVTPGDPLWTTAMDSILLKCVDTDTQVHEEVLRLLLLCSDKGKLDLVELATYLETALDNSRRSRQRYKKRKSAAPMDLATFHAVEPYAGMCWGLDGMSDLGSDRNDWPQSAKMKDADGVRGVYQMFAERLKALDKANAPGFERTAPGLFTYLRTKMSEQPEENRFKQA